MKLKHLSKQDAIGILELIHESVSCSEEQEIRGLFNRLNSIVPFQSYAALMGQLGSDGNLESWELLNSTYPSQYLQEYIKMRLFRTDPVVLTNFRHYRLQSWQDIINSRPFPGNMQSLAEDFGFMRLRRGDGYIHGIKNNRFGGGSLFALYGLKRDNRTETALDLAIPHIHEAMCRILRMNKRHSSLTDKESEVLKWLKHGKNTWDISQILGISERTVKFHISNIMRRLDASTRAHAVAIAIEQGLIGIE